MIDRQKIKAALPYGKLSEIARRAGVGPSTVGAWFNGTNSSERVEEAAVEVYAECVAAQNARLAKYAAVQPGATS